ncbi:MAG: GNAT family N-acetyltransferase [Acidiphilium sp.]|nr:GNAT family N-acetyltransferase [Acidiphilium sp.]MDD4934781.1 GNAT family N-acetyltransferase [Acidiphilium sp.]
MLDYARAQPGETIDRILVTVTFMRLDRKPPAIWSPLPAGAGIELARHMDVAAYRALYDRVGQPWLWWLRRMMPDDMLAQLLADPATAVHVLTLDGVEAGFFELDATSWPDVNLSYFGLLPDAIGQGLGFSLLGTAIERVFSGPVRGMTVNTCTADHPRALPNYQRAGFRITRQINEIWDIPRRLGFDVPDRLRPPPR